MTLGQEIDGFVEKLRRQRDELKLQSHLFKAEAKEEWDKAEARWKKLQARSGQARDAAGDAGEDIVDALKNVGREIRDGYEKIRKTL